MKIVHVRSLALPDIKVVRFARFSDHRGYFTEVFRQSDFQQHRMRPASRGGIRRTNESHSRAGTVGGLHFQWNPLMGKLVRTVAGRMIDFALDIRKGSPFFGKIIAYDMPSTVEQPYGEWIWVPPGFAHGNLFPQGLRIEYLCSGQWSPGCEAGISPLAADLDWSLCDGRARPCWTTPRPAAIDFRQGSCRPDADAMASDPRSENFLYGRC